MSTPGSNGSGSELLRCDQLVVGYGCRAILPAIDLRVRAGELWCVLGRNGSGKTTWFRTVLGLASPLSGSIHRNGSAERTCYIPQRSAFDRHYPLRARDVVRMAMERRRTVLSPLPLREPAAVEQALGEVGAAELADRPFSALSEGQKQRVLLARLVASSAELALLDEPTAAMDVVAEREAFRTLEELCRRRGLAIVVVSHFLGLARDFADRALFLDPQGVVAGTPDEVWRHTAFRGAYGMEATADA